MSDDTKPLAPVRRATFGLGSFANSGPMVTLVQLQPYFSRLGYAASITSNVRFFSLMFDAITDPLMGYISDNTCSRFGRRMSYILPGALLLAAGLCGMWFAPAHLTTAQFYAYLIAMQVVYTLGFTMVTVPYQALIPDLTSDYTIRNTLVSWMQAGTYLGSICGGAVRAYATWRGDDIQGFREFAVYSSLVMIACYMLLVVFLKEPPLSEQQRQALARRRLEMRHQLGRQLLGLGQSLLRSLRDPDFRILFLTVLTYQTGVLAGIWLYPYILLDWFGGTWDTPFARRYVPVIFRDSYFLWIFFGVTCGLLFIPFWNWLGRRLEKRTCLLLGIIAVGLAYGVSYIFFEPRSFPLLIVYCLLLAFAYCPANIFPYSMLADIATHSEYRTGQASEGMFYGAWSFLQKCYGAIAMLWTGFLLDHIVHYQPGAGIRQTAEALLRMRLLYAIPPLVTAALAIPVLMRYRLSRRRMAEVNDALRAGSQAGPPTRDQVSV
jgi:GPH family glycoside/pentoside/hexuronide:cation symporter